MEDVILKKISQLNLDSSLGATLYVKKRDGFFSKKYMYRITSKLNYRILEEFFKMSVKSTSGKIESILIIIHCSSPGEPTHDILLSSNQLYMSYEGLI